MIEYLLAIGLASLSLCGWDKLQAVRHRQRIPEHVLIFLSFAGGCFGMLAGMLLFRHKIRSSGFRLFVPLACAIWLAVACL